MFKLTGGIFEVEDTGIDEQEAVAALAEKFTEGVEFDEHPGWELGETFGRKKGNAFGCGPTFPSGAENTTAFAMFVWGKDAIGFQDFECGAKSISSDLELGGEAAFPGKEIMQIARRDHLLDDLGGLSRKGLSAGDPGHA